MLRMLKYISALLVGRVMDLVALFERDYIAQMLRTPNFYFVSFDCCTVRCVAVAFVDVPIRVECEPYCLLLFEWFFFPAIFIELTHIFIAPHKRCLCVCVCLCA